MSGDERVLDGVRVVELAGDVAGEMLGKLLAEMGADVIKVEPPDGSPSRAVGPFAHDRLDADHSLTFWYYNTNKRSVVIDYRTTEGRDELGRLTAGADVFISTLRRRSCTRSGSTPTRCRLPHPRLVVVSITPFGLTGPWADRLSSDLVGLALGNPLNSCGYDDHSIPPIRPGGDQGYQSAASFALMGLMLALIERQESGEGQLVDVGMHDCLAVNAELANPYWFYPKALVHRQTCRHAQPTPTAAGALPVRRRSVGLLRDLRRRPEAMGGAGRLDGHEGHRRRPARAGSTPMPATARRTSTTSRRSSRSSSCSRRRRRRTTTARPGDCRSARSTPPTICSTTNIWRPGTSSSPWSTRTVRRRRTRARRSASRRSTRLRRARAPRLGEHTDRCSSTPPSRPGRAEPDGGGGALPP